MFTVITAAVLCVSQPERDSELMSAPPPPPEHNALRQFAGNPFTAWHLSRRFEMPDGGNRANVAPMPRQIAR